MKYILETHNLKKKYKKFEALRNINIHIEKGSIYGLIGKNGAGKTTIIRIVCGLQRPTSGTYSIYGISNKDHKINEKRKKMGAIIETPSICLDMTAEDNLKEQYRLVGKYDFKDAKELLKLVGLSDTGTKKAKNFSLGMRQRLGIAVALTGNPELLILDEPINGLDPQGIIELRELILKLNQEKGITFLISSHYLDELSKIATDYGFVDRGKIVEEITSKELEEKCKRRIELEVTDIKECENYLKIIGVNYEIVSDNKVAIFEKINITDIVMELASRNCKITDLHEKEESLENYYMKVIGGDSND
jgi:ABC-2 type transport system ATP-binding protein